jgi:hypothetical protein
MEGSHKLEKTALRKLDLFPSSGEGSEIRTALGPVEGTDLNHCTAHVKSKSRCDCQPLCLGVEPRYGSNNQMFVAV